MDWDAIGAVGEIIGALAVLVTLVYLARQIRQNTGALRAAALNSSIQAASLIRSEMFNSEELSELFLLGSSRPDELDEVQAYRFRNIVSNMLWAIWNFYSQYRYADLSDEAWQSQKYVIVRILSTPGGARYWEQSKQEFDTQFVEVIDQILTDNKC
jgi:hypothetical protein